MVIVTFEELRRAFDAIAQLRAEGLDEDVLVYHNGRLIFVSKEQGRTQVLTLGDEQKRSFAEFVARDLPSRAA